MAIAARSQPQGLARINRSNPLARGLFSTFILQSPSSATDAGTGVPWFADTPFPLTSSKNGRGAASYNGTNRRFTSSALQRPSTYQGGTQYYQPGTVVLLARVDVDTGTNVFLTNQANWWGPSGGQWSYGGTGGSANTAVVLGKEQVIVYTAGLDNVATIWVDGVASTSTFTPGGMFGFSGTTTLLQYGTSGYCPTGALFFAAFFDRKLSPSEIAQVTANPWQLFESPSQTQFPRIAAATGTNATATPSGVSASSAVGSASAKGAATASPAGVSAASSVGSPAAKGSATCAPAGVSATAAVGAATASGATVVNGSASPAGVSASSAVGSAAASGQGRASPAGVSAAASVGTTTASGQSVVYAYPAGVSATSAVGTVSARGGATAYPAGVQAAAAVGQAVGPIDLSSAPKIYATSLMRLDAISRHVVALRDMVAIQSAMSGMHAESSLMRSGAINLTSAMRNAPVNRTANLL